MVDTTVESEKDAKKLAKLLLKRRLIACAQILGPITSSYWWQGNLEEAEEYRISMKTFMTCYEELKATIKENHPYETPEIIATTITKVDEDYLLWMQGELET